LGDFNPSIIVWYTEYRDYISVVQHQLRESTEDSEIVFNRFPSWIMVEDLTLDPFRMHPDYIRWVGTSQAKWETLERLTWQEVE
jgi:hypothetical protein